MIKKENIKEGTITYYPLIEDEKDLTRYEPCITWRKQDGKQVIDLNLNINGITKENWKKIENTINSIFFEEMIWTNSSNAWWNTITFNGLSHAANATIPPKP